MTRLEISIRNNWQACLLESIPSIYELRISFFVIRQNISLEEFDARQICRCPNDLVPV